jgi:hypothetical protein
MLTALGWRLRCSDDMAGRLNRTAIQASVSGGCAGIQRRFRAKLIPGKNKKSEQLL